MVQGTFKLLELVDRAQVGQLVDEAEFEGKLIPAKLKELVKQHDISRDPQVLIPSDNDLADSVFKAAFELLIDVGVYCTDTGRIIKITEEDLKEALKYTPESTIIGAGRERRELKPRAIEEKRPPIITGPVEGNCTSENYLNILTSIAMEPNVDILCCGSLIDIDGRPILPHSPIEIHAALREASWMRQATANAGRPGLCMIGAGFEWVGSDIASFNPEHGFRATDCGCPCIIAPLKTTFNQLARTKYLLDCGRPMQAFSDQLIGGFTGGAEGTVISSVAHLLANLVVNQANFQELNCQHLHYSNTSNRLSIWCHNIGGQSLARNTRIITSSECFASAAPCTDMLLYEGAAVALSVVSGMNLGPGVCGRGTKGIDTYTGLEARLFAEIGKACAGMKREDANDLANQLVKKYEGKFDNPPVGKSFNEAYDPKTLQPTSEWFDIYKKVTKDFENLDVSIA
jgi:methylamine--corrinoid protein Co-methyltransferase